MIPKPNVDRIFIVPDKPKQQRESGIIIPDAVVKAAITTGTIKFVGEECKHPLCKEGSHCCFLNNSGIKMNINGTEYLHMRE